MTKKKTKTYLLAHVNSAGTGANQAKIEAVNLTEALKEFRAQFPNREVTRTGVEGEEG